MLFLHGYLSSGEAFNLQRKFFERDFDVFTPDLKGFGKNADMPYPYALDDYIEDIKEYIDKNSVAVPHAIAHSFGARVAIKAAAQDGTLFDKLVLTGAAGLKPKFSLKKAVKRAEFSLLKKVLPREKLKRFYSSDYLAVNDVMRESFVKIVAENLDDVAENVTNETLIIFGACDKETPPYMAKRLNKKIKNGKLKFIDGAGHFAFIDKPHTFNWEVREFLLE